MLECDITDCNMSKIEVKHLGEKIFKDKDLIENILILKRRDAKQLKFSLLVPTSTNFKIYNKNLLKQPHYTNIESFLEAHIEMIINSVIFIYNKINPKSYLSKYRNNSMGISNYIYKKNIYKVKFEIFGKIECIYFDISESQLFL
ncbi:MAG: hypothetical protein KAJ49_03205 [Arcobacteraceae bacterium]|nr:hypothetical protein [Arcobacteraceae bacterium]